MPRLFVAVELPREVKEQLVRVQPRPATGLRLVQPDQMHLTLHFIGEAELDLIGAALAAVNCSPFEIEIEGVGRFPTQGRATTLWAGVTNEIALRRLHASVGEALAVTGYQPESRLFAPHITLARCGHRVLERLVDDFLSQPAKLEPTRIPVEGFTLFSSTIIDDAPVYKRERWFAF
jgi:2'-5' RNA ligase